MRDKKLIINADDFGLNRDVNRAILSCFQGGIVTSASLLVNREGFHDALEIIKKNPKMDIGLHLNVFSGKSLTSMKCVVDSQNNFLESPARFLFRYYLHRNKVKKEIFEEFTQQIKICLSRNIKISHLDTEKHLHIIPGIFEVILRLAEKYKIKYVRFPFEDTIPGLETDYRQLLKTKLSKIFIRKNQLLLNSIPGVGTTDNFYGISLSRKFSFENIKIFLENLKPGITELSCHPGTTAEGSTYIDKHRPEEFKVLMNPKINEHLIQNNIELTNFVRINS